MKISIGRSADGTPQMIIIDGKYYELTEYEPKPPSHNTLKMAKPKTCKPRKYKRGNE